MVNQLLSVVEPSKQGRISSSLSPYFLSLYNPSSHVEEKISLQREVSKDILLNSAVATLKSKLNSSVRKFMNDFFSCAIHVLRSSKDFGDQFPPLDKLLEFPNIFFRKDIKSLASLFAYAVKFISGDLEMVYEQDLNQYLLGDVAIELLKLLKPFPKQSDEENLLTLVSIIFGKTKNEIALNRSIDFFQNYLFKEIDENTDLTEDWKQILRNTTSIFFRMLISTLKSSDDPNLKEDALSMLESLFRVLFKVFCKDQQLITPFCELKSFTTENFGSGILHLVDYFSPKILSKTLNNAKDAPECIEGLFKEGLNVFRAFLPELLDSMGFN